MSHHRLHLNLENIEWDEDIFIGRERERDYERLFEDYFSKNPNYDFVKFRRRFRMQKELFLLIVQEVCAYDD